jgi:hypothetical protein
MAGRFRAAARKAAPPTSWKDLLIRVVKHFVSGALSGATVAGFTSVTGIQAAVFAGGTAAFGFVQGAIRERGLIMPAD